LPPNAAWLLGGVHYMGLAATLLTLHLSLFARAAAICSGDAPSDLAPIRIKVSIVVNLTKQFLHCHRRVV
jgi:hypothetical protein